MTQRWRGHASVLSAEQIAALGAPVAEPAGPTGPTALDRRLLPALTVDGRADYPQPAGTTGWSESTVRRRVDELRREVAYPGATTGSHNLLLFVVCRDAAAYFDHLVQRIGPLPGVGEVDGAPVRRIVERGGSAR